MRKKYLVMETGASLVLYLKMSEESASHGPGLKGSLERRGNDISNPKWYIKHAITWMLQVIFILKQNKQKKKHKKQKKKKKKKKKKNKQKNYIQSKFNGSNIFVNMIISSRCGQFEQLRVNHGTTSGSK